VLRRATRDLPVEVIVASFEQLEAEHTFGLLFAAAAWHWTDSRTRWTRAVELLAPGGVLALFGIPGDVKDPRLRQTVDDIEQRLLPVGTQAPGHPWSPEDVRRAAGLTDVTTMQFSHSIVSSADDFVGRLGTVSSYLNLNTSRRREGLDAVRMALPDHVEIDATAHLVLARCQH
jgi:hypothetical protein